MSHIDAENRRQTLEEELEFLRQAFDQELKDLSALAYRDSTSANREHWQNELANALHVIQEEYDHKMELMQQEMETQYNMKVKISPLVYFPINKFHM